MGGALVATEESTRRDSLLYRDAMATFSPDFFDRLVAAVRARDQAARDGGR